MALATYGDLKSAVATWLSRADLTTVIPDFISLAHAKLMRVLRTREMETVDAAFSISAELVNLPALFLESRTMSLQTNPRQSLTFMDPEKMTSFYSDTPGQPKSYCVIGGQFKFSPPPDATYTATLVYYSSLAQMSATADTNWILTSHPDAYLYGALLEATSVIQDDPRITLWKAMYEDAVNQIKSNSAKAKYGGVLQTRPG
jgi:hypothetical protein